jgi:predicted nucleic acid-binding protein
MSIVSNASALINLARIGKLDLLHQLYEEITIPEAVWNEARFKLRLRYLMFYIEILKNNYLV